MHIARQLSCSCCLADQSLPQLLHSQPAATTVVPLLPVRQTAAQPSVVQSAVDPDSQDAQPDTALNMYRGGTGAVYVHPSRP